MLIASKNERLRLQAEMLERGTWALHSTYFSYLNPLNIAELLTLVKVQSTVGEDNSVYFHCPMLDREWMGMIGGIEADFRPVIRDELRKHVGLKPFPEYEVLVIAPVMAPPFCARQRLEDFRLNEAYWLPETTCVVYEQVKQTTKRTK